MSCREHAEASCLRCAAPLCSSHEPPTNRRCSDCEASFATVRDEIESARWEPSLQRDAFVLFASVILKIAMMAVAVALLLWALGELPQTDLVIGSTLGWTVALLAVRRVAEGPSKRAMARRARRSFLKHRGRALRRPQYSQ